MPDRRRKRKPRKRKPMTSIVLKGSPAGGIPFIVAGRGYIGLERKNEIVNVRF